MLCLKEQALRGSYMIQKRLDNVFCFCGFVKIIIISGWYHPFTPTGLPAGCLGALSSFHPYGVTDWVRLVILSSCHPYGVGFAVFGFVLSSFHPYGVACRVVGRDIILSPLRGCRLGALGHSIIMPPLRGWICRSWICPIILPPQRGCQPGELGRVIILPPLRGCKLLAKGVPSTFDNTS